MANRSYIYALKGDKHISLSEFNYFIPHAFRILAGFDNKVVESHIFDGVVAIEADFNKGREELYRFLDLLAATNEMTDQEEFLEAVNQTKAFLDPIDADRILLENGEIYMLHQKADGEYLEVDEIEDLNESCRNDYSLTGEELAFLQKVGPERLFHYDNEKYLKLYDWVLEQKEDWRKDLGIEFWSDVLYFQFTSGE